MDDGPTRGLRSNWEQEFFRIYSVWLREREREPSTFLSARGFTINYRDYTRLRYDDALIWVSVAQSRGIMYALRCKQIGDAVVSLLRLRAALSGSV